MNEKLTLQDIIDILAKKAGMTKKDADAFFREFFAVISENIFNNEPVKIKDFDTLKLTRVNSRESIDVNTGEKIEIPAHFKLSFVPDKALKTLVNKPFSQFETTLLKEGVNFDSIEVSEEPAEAPEEEDAALDIIEPVIYREENSFDKEEILGVKRQKTDIRTKIKEIEKTDIKEPGKEKVDSMPEDSETVASEYEYTYTSSSNEEKNESITLIITSEENILKDKEFIPDVEKPTGKTHDSLKDEENSQDRVAGKSDCNPKIELEEVRQKIGELQKELDYWTGIKNEIEVLQQRNRSEKNVEINNHDKNTSQKTDKPESFEDVTEEILKDTRDTGKLLENLVTVENNQENTPTSFDSVQESREEILFEEQEEEYELYDFHQETFASKFRRMLPITIFLVIITGFGAYHFFKLFNSSPSYPSGWEHTGWKETDTLPGGIIGIIPDSVYQTRLEGMNSSRMQEDSVQVLSDLPLLVLENDSLSDKELSTPHTASREEGIYDKVISDNLKIKILRKASYQLEKNNPAGMNFQTFMEVVQRGSTLRMIARKYYGNNIFWVYIYEENKQRIPDFDNVPVGIELVIPEPKKYNINPESPQSLEEAKRREQLIFNRIQL